MGKRKKKEGLAGLESLIFLILIVVFGYACLTSGYHLLPLLYGAAGFAAGLCLWRYLNPGTPWVSEPSMVVSLCGAFLGAVLHEYLMMALVFGLILARFPQMSGGSVLFVAGLGCAVLCAALFHKLFRPCMVIFTAVVGAAILSQALVSLYWYAKQPVVGIAGLSGHLAESLVTPPGGWDTMRILFSVLFGVLGIWGVWRQTTLERG